MKELKGNIINTELKHIFHGANCKGVMGAGVALALKNNYDGLFEEYKNM